MLQKNNNKHKILYYYWNKNISKTLAGENHTNLVRKNPQCGMSKVAKPNNSFQKLPEKCIIKKFHFSLIDTHKIQMYQKKLSVKNFFKNKPKILYFNSDENISEILAAKNHY